MAILEKELSNTVRHEKPSLLSRLLDYGQKLVDDCKYTEEEVDKIIREAKKKNHELWK